MQQRRKILIAMAVGTLVLAGFAINHLSNMARVGVGYMAKIACSEVFVAGRSLDTVLASNFDGINPLLEFVQLQMDESSGTISGDLYGLGSSTAVYRAPVGCTLAADRPLFPIAVTTAPAEPLDTVQPAPRPYQIQLDAKVQEALLTLFDEAASKHPIRTRGSVVIRNGRIVAEHYAPGFSADTRMQSWSLAKGFTQALTGIATGQGLLALDDQALMPTWQAPDPRSAITLGHLLHMASGLEFSEDYADPFSDVDQMLYNQHDMGQFAANQALIAKPGTQSVYSSGTSNIVSRILRTRVEAAGMDYHTMPRQQLFNPIGMRSAVFEVDPSGTFIGSSYIYATTRDFARFGQLYLQDGQWNNRTVLPPGWVDYTRQPAMGTRESYGSHWSLNLDQQSLPGLPEDVFYLGGNDGQYIIVIPSKNAVIVRFGITRLPATFKDDVLPRIQQIYRTL